MEQNLYKALNDIPTLTELAVLSLYSQTISIPYMIHVRGDPNMSALDLGPMHDKVKAHCQAIINNPDLILAADASHESATLFGEAWDKPDAFYTVHQMKNLLPHLRDALKSFFTGALCTWERFTPEFAADGIVATCTAAERARAWMPTTNDPCEGLLGEFRIWNGRAPNGSLDQFNGRNLFKKNGTQAFMDQCFDTRHHEYTRGLARAFEGDQREKNRRLEQGGQDTEQAAGNKARRAALKTKKTNAQAALDAQLLLLEVELDPDNIEKLAGGNARLDLQLEWHRRFDDQVPLKSHLSNKAKKKEALRAAVRRLIMPGRYLLRTSLHSWPPWRRRRMTRVTRMMMMNYTMNNTFWYLSGL